MTGQGTKALDVECPKCSAQPGRSCSIAPLFHQARVNAAARKTRDENLKRRAETT